MLWVVGVDTVIERRTRQGLMKIIDRGQWADKFRILRPGACDGQLVVHYTRYLIFYCGVSVFETATLRNIHCKRYFAHNSITH